MGTSNVPVWVSEPAPDEHLIPAIEPVSPIVVASVDDAGCWIDEANWGWRGIGRMVQIAVGCGWPITEDDAATLDLFLGDEPYDPTLSVPEAMDDMARDAESWLTDHVAPEGYSFGWHDGSFYLGSDGWWCAGSGDQCYCTTPHDEEGQPL